MGRPCRTGFAGSTSSGLTDCATCMPGTPSRVCPSIKRPNWPPMLMMAPASLLRSKRKSRRADEHRGRRGDPTAGGSTRLPIMTAYRQQALSCAVAIAQTPQRSRDVKLTAPDAAKILVHNVCGWFDRVERGVYSLTDAGRKALVQWHADLPPSPAQAPPEPSRKRRSETV